MHISVLVKIEFNSTISSLDEEIDLSFDITVLGVKYRIGTKFGGNIANVFLECLQKAKKNEIFFELTDSPLDIETVDLFAGNTFIDGGEKKPALFYEPLVSRMKKIQGFIKDLFNLKNIKNISMDIDAENTFHYQDFDKINIKVDQFTDTMVKLFKKENQMTPTVRINFEK